MRGGLVRITISDAGGADGKPGTDNTRTPPVSVALLIEEVEAVWAPIAERDDWTSFTAALTEIEEMRQAYAPKSARRDSISS